MILSNQTFVFILLGMFCLIISATLNQWETTTLGSLAKILVFDQFPRNIYRGSAKAFAFDKEVCDSGSRFRTE